MFFAIVDKGGIPMFNVVKKKEAALDVCTGKAASEGVVYSVFAVLALHLFKKQKPLVRAKDESLMSYYIRVGARMVFKAALFWYFMVFLFNAIYIGMRWFARVVTNK